MDKFVQRYDPRYEHDIVQMSEGRFVTYEAYEQLKADLDKLKEYVVHKEDCPARRMYYIRECPRCGSRKNHWQGGGPAFDAYRVCEECDGPAYIPEERLGECSCGLDQALTDNKPDGKDK